jgi:2-C-methyl-D-erythritol 4-phosphate cytidylyltransferase
MGKQMSDPESQLQLPRRESVTALILGAGRGDRFGSRPKALMELRGQTLLEHAVELVSPYCGQVIAGLPGELLEEAGRICSLSGVTLLAGGATRQETVTRLMQHVRGEFVLLHEVARPFATSAMVERLLDAVGRDGAASLSIPLPVRDGLAVHDNGFLECPLDRDRVVALQAPQAFRRDWLVEACERAECEGWSEQSTTFLLHRCGHRISLIEGDANNLKLTWPEDWSDAMQRVRDVQPEDDSPHAG